MAEKTRGQRLPGERPYRYAQLADNTIRLLHLHTDAPSSQLFCSLLTAELTDVGTLNPRGSLMFSALSFTWHASDDERNQSSTIICDGLGFIKITPNLKRALTRVVDIQQKSKSEFLLWVDQICLNQADEIEKSVQIKLMGDIYKAARTVFIYLGEPDQLDIPLLERLHFRNESITPSIVHFMERTNSYEGSEDAKSMKSGYIGYYDRIRHTNSANWMETTAALAQRTIVVHPHAARSQTGSTTDFLKIALGLLLKQSWHGRVWTFQEVVLAEQPLIVYGPLVFHWHLLEHLEQYMVRVGIGHGVDSEDNFRAVVAARKAWKTSSTRKHSTLASLLLDTRMRQATRAHDKVLAVTGLLKSADLDALDVSTLYSLPLETVFRNATEHCLLRDKDLAIFGATRHDQGCRLADTPSWVTDLLQPYAEPFSKWINIWANNGVGPQVEVLPDGQGLEVRGILLDAVTSISEVLPSSIEHAKKSHTVSGVRDEDLRFWRTPSETRQMWSSEGVHLITSLIGAMPAQRYREGPMGLDFGQSRLREYAQVAPLQPQVAITEQQIIWDYVRVAMETTNGRSQPRTNQQEIHEIQRWIEDRHNHPCMKQKTCFSTQRAVGICPSWAQVGDIVCWFAGAHILHLIRPIVSSSPSSGPNMTSSAGWWGLRDKNIIAFELVGECYVRDLTLLPLDEIYAKVQTSPSECPEISGMFVDIELR